MPSKLPLAAKSDPVPMFSRTFYATHPDEMALADTQALRDRYLIRDLFVAETAQLNYLHQERLVIGGVAPVTSAVHLPAHTEPASMAGQPFLAARELGIVNVGEGAGEIEADGVTYNIDPLDALYLGRGTSEVIFRSKEAATPAHFYLASTPAHCAYPNTHIPLSGSHPLHRGDQFTANQRTVHQLVVPQVCASAQLLLGLTILKPGNVWNTMPPHLHDRRSEAYYYFRLGPSDRVFHFMGQPQNTRQIVIANEEAVICPPWSIHSGVGTSNYAFIWAMGGENLDYGDFNELDICQLS